MGLVLERFQRMPALATGHRTKLWRKWRVCPWIAVRASITSLIVVATIALVVDRYVLASLERHKMVASDGWKKHNQVVVENRQKMDRNIPIPGRTKATASGVRAWVGHEVREARSRQHRILVMGDSYVWGSSYLTSNHMWWRQLEIELQRRGYHDVEVIAAGHSGLSTHEELDLAKLVVPEFHPDLILWGYVTNDPDERIVKQIFNSGLNLPIPYRVQAVIQRCVPRLLDLVKSRRGDKLAKSYVGPEYGYEYSDWLIRIHEGENFERYRQTVTSVAEFMKEIQIPGVLVTLPQAPIPDLFMFSYDKILPLWREAGIPVQDNLPPLMQRFPNAEKTGPQALAWGINPADSHPGPRTTAILAQLTVDRLEQNYPQLLGQKTSVLPQTRINDWLPYSLDVKSTGDGKFRLVYPATEELMPTMPLEIPTAMIALEQPVPLEEIQLSGSGLKSARVWLSTYDRVEFYDTQEWADLGVRQGKQGRWQVPKDLSQREASVILFKAEFDANDRELELKLERPLQSIEGRQPR